MAWQADLSLTYKLEAGRCVARFHHKGPLRILQSLYPEGDGVCHNVLVHPPGGLVAGDRLDLRIQAAAGSHGLVTTPGASRFYRSEGAAAVQHTCIALDAGARFEWLPLEALYYSGCIAENRLDLALEPGAQLIGWDIAALGLPQAGKPFEAGRLLQHLELRGAWLERGCIAATDQRLMEGPLGLAGRRCLATLFLCTGEPLGRAQRERALDLARECIGMSELASTAGATAPNDRVVVARVLAPLVEPALMLLKAIRRRWRAELWNLSGAEPRGWAI